MLLFKSCIRILIYAFKKSKSVIVNLLWKIFYLFMRLFKIIDWNDGLLMRW